MKIEIPDEIAKPAKSVKQAVFLYYFGLDYLASELAERKQGVVVGETDKLNRSKHIVAVSADCEGAIRVFLGALDSRLKVWAKELGEDVSGLVSRPVILTGAIHATWRVNDAFCVERASSMRAQQSLEMIRLSFSSDTPLLSRTEFEEMENIMSSEYEHADRLRTLRRTGSQYIVNTLTRDGENIRKNINKMLVLVGGASAPLLFQQRPRKKRSDADGREIVFSFEGGGFTLNGRSCRAEAITLFLSSRTKDK